MQKELLILFCVFFFHCSNEHSKKEFTNVCNDISNFYKNGVSFINIKFVKRNNTLDIGKIFLASQLSKSPCYPLNQIYLKNRDSPIP